MSKKLSAVDPPTKKISVVSIANSDTPPRKKSSLKENISNLIKAPNFVLKREAAKKQWNHVCENLRLSRIKIAVTESKLFSPGQLEGSVMSSPSSVGNRFDREEDVSQR
ncbi:unnamed protein product [Haemonchus placei]|uniref:Uncharacterized protein n=1 Tax=Haemonchus placei TaxID=6290 RepID=A0A0N4WAU2_HAEPC|nr:unnamed protein product [Haemonchus placei]